MLVPKTGVPDTLLTRIKVPISNGTNAVFTLPLSLGFSKSTIVVPGVLTLNPLTYAFPELTSRHAKSSDGVFPCSVTSLDLNIPPLDNPLSKDSATSTSKLSIE